MALAAGVASPFSPLPHGLDLLPARAFLVVIDFSRNPHDTNQKPSPDHAAFFVSDAAPFLPDYGPSFPFPIRIRSFLLTPHCVKKFKGENVEHTQLLCLPAPPKNHPLLSLVLSLFLIVLSTLSFIL